MTTLKAAICDTATRFALMPLACICVLAPPVSLAGPADESPPRASDTLPASQVDDGIIQEITVTSRRQEESLQKAAVAVTAFSEETLENRSIADAVSLASFVPNLSATTGLSGGSNANYFIRGVGQVDHIASVDPAVATYVDGVYLGRANGADVATVDIQRVEVLRGPQGTLFGKNTMGGAIHIITREPGNEPAASAKLTLGSRDWAELRGSINVPIQPDTLAARLSFNAKTQDGYGRRLSDGQTLGDETTFSGRARVLWRPADDIELDLQADARHTHGSANMATLGGIGTLGFFPPGYEATYKTRDPYRTNAGFDAGDDMDAWGSSVRAEWTPSAHLSVSSITAYRALRQSTGTDFDSSPLPLIDQRQLTDQRQFSQEFQLGGTAFAERLRWLAGAYYFDERVQQAVPVFLLTPTPLNQLNDIRIENVALFGQAMLSMTDRFSITAGARMTEEKKEHTINNFFFADAAQFASTGFPDYFDTPPDRRGFETIPETTLEKRWSAFTPKLSLDFQATDDLLLYASYAEGFKSGGFNGRPNGTNDFLPYDPEQLNAYEIGLKSEWADGRLQANVAAFFSDYQDVQLLALRVTQEGALSIFTENAAEAELYGVEIEAIARPVRRLEINASVGYLHNEYKRFDPSVIIPGVDLDDELPQAPEWSVAVGVGYEQPAARGYTVNLRADYSYKSSFYFFAANNPLDLQQGYDIVNVRAALVSPDDRWQVAVFAHNLFDTFYFSQREDGRDSFDIAIDWPAPPRSVGLEMQYRF